MAKCFDLAKASSDLGGNLKTVGILEGGERIWKLEFDFVVTFGGGCISTIGFCWPCGSLTKP